MTYTTDILPSAEKDCNRLSKSDYERCYKAMRGLEINPRPRNCRKLVGQDSFRIRVGSFRILYRVDDSNKKIIIYRVKHRKDVYRFK